ncbi:hypothetical protein ACVWYJ_002320 [Bradyrhizobium sp. USDA 4471]
MSCCLGNGREPPLSLRPDRATAPRDHPAALTGRLPLVRNPSMSKTTARTMAEPMNTKPPVIIASFQGAASCPVAVIGESAAVPSTAADVVTIQLPYVPMSSAQ